MTKKVRIIKEEDLAPETSVHVELKEENPESGLKDHETEEDDEEDDDEGFPKLGGFLVMDLP